MKLQDDAIITEVRAARHRISERSATTPNEWRSITENWTMNCGNRGEFRFVTEFYSTEPEMAARK